MDSTVEAFKRYSTAAISDAMDRLGLHGTALGISPLDPSFKLTGRAYTIHYRTIGYVERGTVGDAYTCRMRGDSSSPRRPTATPSWGLIILIQKC